MKAVRTLNGGGMTVTDVPVPDAGPGRVLVKVAGAGLCHSDVMIARFPSFYGSEEFTLGHEVAGWREPGGEPVIVHAMWGCGLCRTCTTGGERICPVVAPAGGAGLGLDGGLAEYIAVPERYVLPLGDLDPCTVAPLADAALTPYHAIRSARELCTPGSVAVVIGIGGLGHMAVQLLRTLTPSTIIAVELDAERRALALELGADVALDPSDDVAARIEDGAALVLDLVGKDETLALAASVARKRGRVVLIGAALGSFSFSLMSMPWECALQTSYGGEAFELAEVVALAQRGRITVHARHTTLDEVPARYEAMDAGDHGTGRLIAVP